MGAIITMGFSFIPRVYEAFTVQPAPTSIHIQIRCPLNERSCLNESEINFIGAALLLSDQY
jgi:hypothetical protein